MIDAAKLIQGDVSLELADQMALALRRVSNLGNERLRFEAYELANVDLVNTSQKDQYAADAVALSIELTRRLAGHQ